MSCTGLRVSLPAMWHYFSTSIVTVQYHFVSSHIAQVCQYQGALGNSAISSKAKLLLAVLPAVPKGKRRMLLSVFVGTYFQALRVLQWLELELACKTSHRCSSHWQTSWSADVQRGTEGLEADHASSRMKTHHVGQPVLAGKEHRHAHCCTQHNQAQHQGRAIILNAERKLHFFFLPLD